jgi:LysM repeat protein
MQVFGLKVLFICLLFSMHSVYSQTEKSPTDLMVAPVITDNSASQISIIDSILNFSKQYIGRPYRGGGKGPNSFDCSGFTSFVFSNFGIKLGSSSGDQAEQLPTVAKNEILPGDLVFFNGHRRGSRVGHVGLVVSKHENGTFDFIHSASSVGISISHSESNYYDRRYVSAGRVFTTDSLLASYKFKKQNIAIEPEISIQSEVCDDNKTIEIPVRKTIPAKYHTVKSGETLSSIANKYGLSIAQLKRKNNLKSDFLSLKQRLKIKDKQEIEVVEKHKPTVASAIKTDFVKVDNLNVEVKPNENKSEFYTVKKGETLFSISKEFGVKVKDLIRINNLKTESILAGQRIKLNEDVKFEKAHGTQKNDNQSADNQSAVLDNAVSNETTYGTHVVTKGETLQSISKQYKLTIAELKELNKLSSDNILAGQKLITPTIGLNKNKPIKAKQKTLSHTVKSGETLSEIAEKYNCTIRELKAWNGKSNNKLNLGEKLKIVI